MREIEVTTRKWGNSLGITLPKEIVEKERLGENQRIFIKIRPTIDLRPLRGLCTFKKTAQQLKDEMREGWE